MSKKPKHSEYSPEQRRLLRDVETATRRKYTPAEVDSINAEGQYKRKMAEHRQKMVKAVGDEHEYRRRLS